MSKIMLIIIICLSLGGCALVQDMAATVDTTQAPLASPEVTASQSATAEPTSEPTAVPKPVFTIQQAQVDGLPENMEILYPQVLSGDAALDERINQLLQTSLHIEDCRLEALDIVPIQEDEGIMCEYSVTYDYELMNDVLGIHMDLVQYTGGAHGGHVVWNAYVLLSEARLLEESDWLIDGGHAAVLEQLKAWVEPELDGMYSSLPENWNMSMAVFSIEGVTITFGEYEIAPYAAGMPSFTLTWNELKQWLREDSIIYAAYAGM